MDQNRLASHSEESFRVTKWGTSGPDDLAQNYFKKNVGDRRSKEYTVQSGANQSVHQYHTEFSQITNVVDNGFKRLKYNQMETLNQLRQQYEILRNLPVQQDILYETHYKKHSEGSIKQSASSSSKKSRKHRKSYGKQMQMMSLQKKQLEMVIGNSMRKIQDLLNNEVEYKRIIHELQLKLDSRGSQDKLDGTIKNLKRNQQELNDKIQSLKREIERLKELNRQLSQKLISCETQLSGKDQEIRKCRQEKKRIQDQYRLERDRNSQLEIQYKKLKVQYEMLEKDKNSQINRLNKTISQHKSEIQNYIYRLKTLEQQLKSKDSMIESLKQDIERLRNRPIERPKIIQKKNNNEEQFAMLQTLISHLREESSNQSKASTDLIASILKNVDNKKYSPPPQPKNNENGLLQELQNIKEELSRLRLKKQEAGSRIQYQGNSEYLSKIANLQNDLADSQLDNLKLKEDNTNLRNSYDQMQQDLDAVHKECLELRNKLGANENNTYFSTENLKAQFRQRQAALQEQIRNLQRKLDEALFNADRQRKDKQHTLNLLRSEHSSTLKLLQDQVAKLEREKNDLRAQLQKMKQFYESKLRQKNQLLKQLSYEKSTLIETHEKTLMMSKNANEKEMSQLLRKLHDMAEINDRYMKLSAQCSEYERQVHELRHLIRKFKVLNDNVDHLWMVKEAEYSNLHMFLDSMKTY